MSDSDGNRRGPTSVVFGVPKAGASKGGATEEAAERPTGAAGTNGAANGSSDAAPTDAIPVVPAPSRAGAAPARGATTTPAGDARPGDVRPGSGGRRPADRAGTVRVERAEAAPSTVQRPAPRPSPLDTPSPLDVSSSNGVSDRAAADTAVDRPDPARSRQQAAGGVSVTSPPRDPSPRTFPAQQPADGFGGVGVEPPPPTRGYEAPARPRETERPAPEVPVGDPGAASRRAHLRVSRFNPKTVLRVSFVFSLCVFVVLMVAVAVLWIVLDAAGVFSSIESAAQTLTDKSGGGISGWLGFPRVMIIAFLIGLVNVVLMTVLSTLTALLYNLCSELVGGVEVTLSER